MNIPNKHKPFFLVYSSDSTFAERWTVNFYCEHCKQELCEESDHDLNLHKAVNLS